MNARCRQLPVLLLGMLLAMASDAEETKTVIGSSNPDLKEGADALLAGDAVAGVELTLRGLRFESSRRDRLTAMSNLCGGYVMLNKLDLALSYCNKVLAEDDQYWRAYSNRAIVYIKQGRYELAEADLLRGEAIRPNASDLRKVRTLFLDATDPVEPTVTIDERRQPATENEVAESDDP